MKTPETVQQWFEAAGNELLERLNVRTDQPVLDFGCGIGSLAVPLASRVSEAVVYAVDKSRPNLRTLEKHAAEYGPFPNLRILHTDGRVQFPEIPSEHCQAVFVFDVLQHLEDWAGLFDECRRILVPHGVLHVNPSAISHPGRVDTDRLERLLADQEILLKDRIRTKLMHYKHMAEDEILSFAKVTPFQALVFRTLQSVPEGSVTTYGRLAEAIGCPSAQAVGQALRRNPCAPRVPCHRVVAADATLGGFAGETNGVELERKRRLLEDEGVHFNQHGALRDPNRLISPRS